MKMDPEQRTPGEKSSNEAGPTEDRKNPVATLTADLITRGKRAANSATAGLDPASNLPGQQDRAVSGALPHSKRRAGSYVNAPIGRASPWDAFRSLSLKDAAVFVLGYLVFLLGLLAIFQL